jgi:hypothetical protein
MPKKYENTQMFTAQPYPLYAWGMWVEAVFDEDFSEIEDYEFNIDRLTVVGWMQNGGQVVPMVSSIGHGVVPLYAFADKPIFCPYRADEQLVPGRLDDEFVLVEISLAEPDSEVYEAAQDSYRTVQKYRRLAADRKLATVVEEAGDE